MKQFADNEQDHLAARFHIEENHLIQASHLAFLKIQSWRFALTTPMVGKRYRREAADMLDKAFFNYIHNTHILSEEGFYFTPLN